MDRLAKLFLRPDVLVLVFLAAVEIIHVRLLFGRGELLAGGDNYVFLNLGRDTFQPYVWDIYYSLGVRNATVPDLLGLPLYSQLFRFLPVPLLQRVLIYLLYFFRFVAFVKLAKLFSRKYSFFSLLAPTLLYAFNVFESLNAFSLFSLLYSVYLPLSLYYFIKIYESQEFNLSDIAKLILLSVVFSPINSNAALALTIFIPQVVYLLLNFRSLTRSRLKNLSLYGLLLVLANLWWAFPLLTYFGAVAADFFGQRSYFTATTAGQLFQNFRFIGQWGWYGRHFLYPYYPYSRYFDHPLVVVFSYLLVILALYEATLAKVKIGERRNKIFLLGLALVGLFLMSGARLPFGALYQFLFDNLPGFKIFREPFTKFGALYVLPICLLLFLFLVRLESFASQIRKYLLLFFVFFSVVLSIKPSLLGENVTDWWNGSSRTFRIRVPDYWQELSDYARENLVGKRILTTPKFVYGGAWNWPQGFTSADDIAQVFLYPGSNVLRTTLVSPLATQTAIDGFFDSFADGVVAQKYLSLLGVNYVLQENDFDWRYTSGALDPQRSNGILKSYLRTKREFGFFSPAYLATIVNDDPNRSFRQDLDDKLTNQPALALYEVGQNLVSSKIYAPAGLIFADSDHADEIAVLIRDPAFVAGDVFFKPRFDLTPDFEKDQVLSSSSTAVRYRQNRPQSLEFREINPSKYLVKVSQAPPRLLLQFIEGFDPDWKVFLAGPDADPPELGGKFLNERIFETMFLYQLPDEFHYRTNGLANGWLLDAESWSSSGKIARNPDGTYDYNLLIEFLPQMYFYFNSLILVLVLIFSLGVVVSTALRSNRLMVKKATEDNVNESLEV